MKATFTIRDGLALLLLILFQGFILSELNVQKYLQPQVYILGLLVLSTGIPKAGQLLIAFTVGILLDSITLTFGMHAFAAVFLQFVKIQYFQHVYKFPENTDSVRPSALLGVGWFFLYLLAGAFVYHLVLFYLSHLGLGQITSVFLTTVYSTPIAVFTMLILVFAFYRQRQS